jgi:hypothetical protein
MAEYGRDGSGNVDALKSDGTTVAHSDTDGGCTLANSTTYYFVVGSDAAVLPAQTELACVHLKWAAAVAATITVETCNFPRYKGGFRAGAADVTDYDTTAGNWISENPTTAYVAVSGSGNSATQLVVTAGGSAAGGCMFHLGNLGSRRVRIKVVATTGGVVRCNVHGKQGG